jgi:hypothetical protein
MQILKKEYNQDQLRLNKSIGDWWDIIWGGLLTSLILIAIGNIALRNLNLNLWLYPYYVLCILIVAYYQWRDDNLTIVQTGFSRAENMNLVTSCLDKLEWHYDKKKTRIDLENNKYFLKFLNPTIVPDSERILINFQYHSTSQTGRLPFFFGISTFLEWIFIHKLKKGIAQTSIHQIHTNNNNVDEKVNP